MPDLKGKVDGISVRAPVPTGSITDLVVRLGREASIDEINAAYREAAGGGPLEGILRYADDPLVSTDIVHSQYSCIIDSELTMANGTMAKVFGWYDNEWGYSCGLVDLVGTLLGEGARPLGQERRRRRQAGARPRRPDRPAGGRRGGGRRAH